MHTAMLTLGALLATRDGPNDLSTTLERARAAATSIVVRRPSEPPPVIGGAPGTP